MQTLELPRRLREPVDQGHELESRPIAALIRWGEFTAAACLAQKNIYTGRAIQSVHRELS